MLDAVVGVGVIDEDRYGKHLTSGIEGSQSVFLV